MATTPTPSIAKAQAPAGPQGSVVDAPTGQANLEDYNTALQVNTAGGDAANVNLVEGKDEPKAGETVYVKGVFGDIVDPTPPVTHIPHGKAVKVKFNAWHSLQWKAGKITTDE